MRRRIFTFFFLQSMQSGSAELQIFSNQGRAEVQKRNFRSLVVKAERKCGSGASDLWQSRQSRSAEAELQMFGSQGRAEVWKWNFTSLEVLTERSAEAELHIFGRLLSY